MLVYIHGMPCLLQNCLDLAEPERRQSGGMVAAFLFFFRVTAATERGE